ncbi:sugar kinase (plasmid) [Paracoccus denitrificans]|uniref:sugar kinase n=1 Tax=Paracoccus denitrificans TaxID=266 RepID=UPI001E5CEDC2|nr:sugar kinase [Paracoccus denitrificans]UFS67961.1 sugar kinase [Paracoccus denitrificans]
MRYLCIGEPLVEFTARRDAPSTFDRRAGGDTLNSAIYLARLMPAGSVGYLSQLGDDAMSRWLRGVMAEEGVADLCATEPGGHPGLSFISTDMRGERSFLYWREQAPARRMFQNGDEALHAVAEAGTVLLSGVTLAILLPESRERLFAALERRLAAGGRIVLDTNYRHALWPDAAVARQVIARAAALATLILPSLDDLAGCFGVADPAGAMALLAGLGGAEIVLTTGGDEVLHRAPGRTRIETHPLPPKIAALDTTGAGDSFNAGWLVASEAGLSPVEAVALAARLASVVVAHPGAVIPRSAMPDLGLRVAT